MMGKYNIWFALLVFLFLVESGAEAQQDPKFNQYMFNPLGINPAYAGSREKLSVVALFRNQWIGFDGAPTTQAFSIHGPLMNKKMGLGFQITNDAVGARNTINAEVDYAYRFPLFKGKLSLGLGAGVNYYTFDWESITYKDEGDQVAQFGVRQIVTPDVDFGAFYNTRTLYIGFELAHLLQPRGEFNDSLVTTGLAYKQFRHLSVTVGKAIVLNKKLTLKPSILYKQAGLYRGALDINFSVLLNEKLWLGLTGRPGYGAAAIIEYVVGDKYRIGYSFDYPLNSLRFSNGSSHELFLGIDLALPKSSSVSPRYF